MELETAAKQQSSAPNPYAAWNEIVANAPGLKRGQTMTVQNVEPNEDGSATYTEIAQTFTPRQYVKDVRWIVTGRCRAAVSRPRSRRPATKPRHARRSTSSSTASDPPDAADPPAALAAPPLPQAAIPAADHPPAAFTSFTAGADSPCPDYLPAVRAAAGGQR